MKVSRAIVAGVLLCAAAAVFFLRGRANVQEPQPEPQSTRAFHGTVKDLRGARLGGALVEATWVGADAEPIRAGAAAAGGEGLYRLTIAVPALADGILVLSATAPGHERAGRRVDPAAARQDFVLAASPARVTVAVKDERGLPIRSAPITLSVEPDAGEAEALLVLSAETAPGGAAVFEGIPGAAATLHWSARASGYAQAFGDRRKAWGPEPLLIEVTLTQGAEVHGTVAEADGQGVAGAEVVLAQEMGPWSAKARTGSTGAFTLRDVPRGSVLVAQLEADAHVLADGQDEVRFSIPEGARTWELNLKAQPAGRIAGVVETSRGQGIGTAVLDAIPADGRMSRRKAAQTDREGAFRITGLRLDTEWRLEARHPDFAPAFVESVKPSRSAGDLRIRLVAGGSVAGSVATNDGAPASGIEAYAHRTTRTGQVVAGLREFATVRSGEDGRYRIDHLNPGTYRVEVRPAARMAWGSIAAKAFEVEVREGEVTAVERVTLMMPGTLQARFVVGSAEAGDPFAQLSFMQEGAAGAPHQVTAQRGGGGLAIVEGLEPGRYDITARLERNGSSTLRGIEIRSGAVTEASFDFAVRPALTGTVERRGGAPVAGAQIDAFSPTGGSQGRYSLPGRVPDNFSGNKATTDAAGRYRVEGLDPGPYIVRVTTKGEAPVERIVRVGPGDAVADFALAAPASAEIRVVGAEGKPLASKVVVLEADPLRAAAGYSESVVTDADGVARFAGLPAGTHVARVVAGAQPTLSFDARAGQMQRVTVTVPDVQAAR